MVKIDTKKFVVFLALIGILLFIIHGVNEQKDSNTEDDPKETQFQKNKEPEEEEEYWTEEKMREAEPVTPKDNN
ncbi:hypothetical protein MM221_16165 [Salipaludibacillus sp. LMS25]|uniref:hypothetical protein n=1 Tax=Salipaludibacillus sp. LMS25 TaxID=2924031 RepID=UPI0020D11AEA|nr:hypothetical protein [Salipaludibacillus sp. LMS25]UTR14103.1 hypothetical protein MM221_16165 [Salipaludibacillus sp. LMS25]